MCRELARGRVLSRGGLAFALFRRQKYASAEQCCVNVRNLIVKLKIVDPDLEAGTREIYDEVVKQKAKKSRQAAPEEMKGEGDEEDDWDTDSEAEEEADEDEEMAD